MNATFYRLPTRRTVERWAMHTPDHFVFAIKASRYLTHVNRLRELRDGLRRLRDRLEPLQAAGKLGPVLWQLPPTFARDDERLAAALDELGSGPHAFEFRHPSWFAEDVAALLRAHDVAFVIADSRRRRFPDPSRWRTAPWAYVRFHDGHGRDGNYSERQLAEWAARLRRCAGYAFFNNDWEGFAVANALRLRELLRSSGHASPTRPRRRTPALRGARS